MTGKKKILFSGGGSGGPVVPLLAVVDALRENDSDVYEFLWLGTKQGPEKGMIENADIRFKTISSGKLRRYFSWKNFVDPFFIIMAFWQSIGIIKKFKPDLVMSAGAFVSVPVVWAAWLLRVPVIIHQQDARPGLANRLMAPLAKVITVSFEKSLKDYGEKASWIGNPIRADFLAHKLSRREAKQKFGLRSDKPILVVMGGGTGAVAINSLVEESARDLAKFCQIIHITGKGKASSVNNKLMEEVPNYKYFEWMDKFGMIKAYTVAEVIVSRCGMSSLTELSQLGLVSVLIPMPNSHQEENAQIFKDSEAAVVLNQKDLDKDKFVREIKKLFDDESLRSEYKKKIKTVMKTEASHRMVEIIKRL